MTVAVIYVFSSCWRARSPAPYAWPGPAASARTAALRAPPPGVLPLAAAVARLLHRREGGSDHDPHDERHRGAQPAVPGRSRQPRRAGPHDGRSSPCVLFALQRRCSRWSRSSLVVPAMTALTHLVPLGVRHGLRARYATASPKCSRDLQESLSGIRIITAFNRRRHNVVAAPHVVGPLPRRQPPHGARSAPSTGRAPTSSALLGQMVVLAHRRAAWCSTAPSSIGELTAFVLYLTAFFAPIQQLVQLYTTYQSGPGGRHQAPRAARDRARRCREARRDRPAADRRARSSSTT